MDNILNVRVKQLIKEVLVDYAKVFCMLFSIALFASLILIGFLTIVVHASVYDTIGTNVVIEIIGFAGFIFVMFISGIVSGAELPMYVRLGIARNEYFKANLIGAIIVSIILMPIPFLADWLLSLVVSSRNVIAHSISDNLLGFAMHVLLLILFYLTGHFIAVVFQRFGWFVGVIVIILILTTSGMISWGAGIITMIPNALAGYNSFANLVAPELLGPILITISVVLASVVYLFVKNAAVKVR